jgi:hypothetical protein
MLPSVSHDYLNQYQLKISLDEICPEIWRRVVVPDDLSLDRVHDVIQILFGWKDYHLYKFEKSGKKYMEFLEPGDKELPAGKYKIRDLFKRKGSVIKYIYDFGDDWFHTITLEEPHYITTIDLDGYAKIRCLDGAMAAPPEDVGGPDGYNNFLKAINNRKPPRNSELRLWYADCYDGKEFNSDEFNINKMNYILTFYQHWNRKRILPYSFECD